MPRVGAGASSRHYEQAFPDLEGLRARARQWKKPTPNQAMGRTRRWLEKQGFELIGRGVHAHVFAHPKDRRYVLKVFRRTSPAGQATLAYLKACMENVNPMMPRVSRIYRVGPVAVVAMERLVTRPAGVLTRVTHSLQRFFERETFLLRPLRPKDIRASARPVPRWQRESYQHNDLVALSDVLAEIYENVPRCGFDLHEENAMFRPLGKGSYQLVITDPLS